MPHFIQNHEAHTAWTKIIMRCSNLLESKECSLDMTFKCCLTERPLKSSQTTYISISQEWYANPILGNPYYLTLLKTVWAWTWVFGPFVVSQTNIAQYLRLQLNITLCVTPLTSLSQFSKHWQGRQTLFVSIFRKCRLSKDDASWDKFFVVCRRASNSSCEWGSHKIITMIDLTVTPTCF